MTIRNLEIFVAIVECGNMSKAADKLWITQSSVSQAISEMEKEYIVDTSLPLPRGLCDDFMKGLRVEDTFYRCKEAEELNSHRMRIVLVEGKNREIRRVFESREIGIKSLMRIRIGCVGVGGLQFGEFRDLTQAEIQALLRLCKSSQY